MTFKLQSIPPIVQYPFDSGELSLGQKPEVGEEDLRVPLRVREYEVGYLGIRKIYSPPQFGRGAHDLVKTVTCAVDWSPSVATNDGIQLGHHKRENAEDDLCGESQEGGA